MGKGIEKISKISGLAKKHLREIGEQLYHTTVLYNRLCPEFKPLYCKRLHQKTACPEHVEWGRKMTKKTNKKDAKNFRYGFVSIDRHKR